MHGHVVGLMHNLSNQEVFELHLRRQPDGELVAEEADDGAADGHGAGDARRRDGDGEDRDPPAGGPCLLRLDEALEDVVRPAQLLLEGRLLLRLAHARVVEGAAHRQEYGALFFGDLDRGEKLRRLPANFLQHDHMLIHLRTRVLGGHCHGKQ